MTKEEFAEHLRKAGYDAFIERNCVMAIGDHSIWKKMREIAKEVGYDSSYGWRPVRERKHENEI